MKNTLCILSICLVCKAPHKTSEFFQISVRRPSCKVSENQNNKKASREQAAQMNRFSLEDGISSAVRMDSSLLKGTNTSGTVPRTKPLEAANTSLGPGSSRTNTSYTLNSSAFKDNFSSSSGLKRTRYYFIEYSHPSREKYLKSRN